LLKIKTQIEIQKVCSLNVNQPIRSNPHELSALLAQHVTPIKIHPPRPIFGLDSSRICCSIRKITIENI